MMRTSVWSMWSMWIATARIGAVAAMGVAECRLAGADIACGPYVTNPGRTSMAVRWTADGLDDGMVRYGAEGEPMRKAATRVETLRYPSDPKARGLALEGLTPAEIATAYLYAAPLEGLRPGTAYRYAVEFGGQSVEGGFRTLAAEPEPLTFIAFGDSHAKDVVADRFAQHEPAFLINLGDTVHYESYPQYRAYFSPAVSAMTRRFPMAVVRGNHDQSGRLLARLFGLNPERLYFAFEHGNALFVQLDSSLWRSARAREQAAAMLNWAEGVLSESDATWKIVSFHEPPYDMSYRRSRLGRANGMAVFRRTGVDLILNGHAHTYQRFAPLYRRGENDERPILLVNSSGAGGIYTTLARRSDPYLVARRAGAHYVVMRIDGDTLSGQALDREGTVFDTFAIRKEGGRPVAEYVASALPEEPYDRLDRSMARLFMEMPGEAFEAGDEFEVPIKFTAGAEPIRYEMRPAPDSARTVELVEPARGEVPAEGRVRAHVKLRAKVRIRDLGRGSDSRPRVFLDCHYAAGEIEGVISSDRVYVRRPAPPPNADAAE